MTDLPPPDLMDNRGRLRRIVIALLVAGAAGAAAYTITEHMAKPDEAVTTGAWQFVFYVTGFVGMGVFLAVLTIQNKLADRAYRKSLVPLAKALKNDER